MATFPGVPPLSAAKQAPFLAGAGIIRAGTALLSQFFGTPQWGIFNAKTGATVAAFDSVLSVEYRHETDVMDYRVEQGAFQSYNKVQLPWDAKIRFVTAGGTGILGSGIGGASGFFGIAPQGVSNREAVLNALEAALLSLDIYQVITPEVTYPSANIVDYSYERSASGGVNLLVVDVRVRQIIATATAQTAALINNPQNPAADPANSNGSTAAQSVAPAKTPTPTTPTTPRYTGTIPAAVPQSQFPTQGTTVPADAPSSTAPAAMPGGFTPQNPIINPFATGIT
jgi:hypothetical protein